MKRNESVVKINCTMYFFLFNFGEHNTFELVVNTFTYGIVDNIRI